MNIQYKNTLFCLILCWLIVACDSQDVVQGSQMVTSTQKAYKAYEIRGLVIDEIMKTHGLKRQLENHWRKHDGFSGFQTSGLDENQSINPKTGAITLDLSGLSPVFQSGDKITLNPEISDGYFDWQCRSNVTSNRVPGSCQE